MQGLRARAGAGAGSARPGWLQIEIHKEAHLPAFGEALGDLGPTIWEVWRTVHGNDVGYCCFLAVNLMWREFEPRVIGACRRWLIDEKQGDCRLLDA